MRDKVPERLEAGRVISGPIASSPCDKFNGAFLVQGPCGEPLRIIASTAFSDPIDEGWDHVSVSTRRRVPNWEEMCFVKRLFWDDEETVIQLHPPQSTWISNHPFVLHLWRDQKEGHRLPPPIMVGDRAAGEIRDRAHAEQLLRDRGLL